MVALRRQHNWIQHHHQQQQLTPILTTQRDGQVSPSCHEEFAAKSTTNKTMTKAAGAEISIERLSSSYLPPPPSIITLMITNDTMGAGNGSENEKGYSYLRENINLNLAHSNHPLKVDDKSSSTSCTCSDSCSCCFSRTQLSFDQTNRQNNSNKQVNLASISNKMAEGILSQCFDYQDRGHDFGGGQDHHSDDHLHYTNSTNTHDSSSRGPGSQHTQRTSAMLEDDDSSCCRRRRLEEHQQQPLVVHQQPIIEPIKYQLVRTTTTCYSPSITTVCSRRLAIVFAIALSSYCLLSAVKVGYCAPVSKSISNKPNSKPMNVIGAGGHQIVATNQQQQQQQQLPLAETTEQHQPGMTSSSISGGSSSSISGSNGLGSTSDGGEDAGFVDELADTRNTMVARDEELAELLDEDETIVLVLANRLPTATSTSIRRLIKRSGISDQRLAEIQMIRALKKQLEKASKLAATGTGAQETGQATS